MNGAESLIRTLVAGGVKVCFTNPGTSEMHVVAALDRLGEMRCVLGLFEGVATGAADGYAMMTGKPASTLLHLGPGLANGLANLHNARRARVPIINIVGQHATYQLRHDTPLTSDIGGIAWAFSQWVRSSSSASTIGQDAADAILAASVSPGQIATLIVPADAAWNEGGNVAKVQALPLAPLPATEIIERAAAMLRSGLPTGLIIAGTALSGKGLAAAGRIATGTGAKLLAPYPFARMERGAGVPPVERIPYILEQAAELLRGFRQLILVGAQPPVSYFASPGKNSILTSPESELLILSRPEEDCAGALEALGMALSLLEVPTAIQKIERPPLPTGEITLRGLAVVVAALLPEQAIVVDESMTSGREMMAATRGGPSHDWLANTGGAIGIALPLAVGAAVACPDRRVLCLSADGSGMYTLQALWTMARENLKVTTVVFANRAYAVLKREFSNLGIGVPGPLATDLFEIGRPDLNWVSLAKGMGVTGTRVTSLDLFGRALEDGFKSGGPMLIEVVL
ncbi:MAG: acetolactate synthase large subunit [Candidatus Acidiferrum sp.]